MIATFNGRKFRKFRADGYSTQQVEGLIDHPDVEIFTNEDAPEGRVVGGAPLEVERKLEEIGEIVED